MSGSKTRRAKNKQEESYKHESETLRLDDKAEQFGEIVRLRWVMAISW